MKLTLARSSLTKALGQVARIVERRNTIPILSNLALRTDGDALVITATDLDMTATARIEAEVAMPGATTLPAQMLHDIARKLPEGAGLTLEADAGGNNIILRSGRSRFALQSLPIDDFPDMAAGELPTRFQVPAAALAETFGRASFAMSSEETRYYLSGIYWHAFDGRLRHVATDGHRLARIDLPLPAGAEAMPGVILPRKTVAEIMRLAGGAEGDVVVSLSATKVRFEIGAVTLTSKLIDGTFPDYMRVIPTENKNIATFDRLALLASAERVAAICSERSRSVKVALNEDGCTLEIRSPDSGEATEGVDAVYDAAPIEIGFNIAYLSQIVDTLPGERINLRLGDAGSPAILDTVGDDSLLIVLMPMRV